MAAMWSWTARIFARPIYTEVKEFSLRVDGNSPLFRDFDIPYSDKIFDQELKASILGICRSRFTRG